MNRSSTQATSFRWGRRWLLVGSTVALSTAFTLSQAQAQSLPGMEKPQQEAPATASASTSQGAGIEQLDLSLLLNPEIESASLVAEPVSEAPAPVTVITSEMIEASGARNLQEVLITYVPGMTLVADQNERNVAMRGVYTSSQQKILVLLNGHRLNSRVFSSAAPDFSIGIHPSKVQQIEVVRGPGSSVYGNLALNGVINIVTKDAGDLNGVEATAGFGNFGQVTGDVTYGQEFGDDQELLLWGSFYRSEGQLVALDQDQVYNAREVEDPQALLGHYNDPGSYDIGLEYKVGDFTVMGILRQGKYTEPFSAGGSTTGEAYEYDDYRQWDGVGPGFAHQSGHAELAWEREFAENWAFETSLYFDSNRTQQHLIMDPSAQLHGNITWLERTFGNISQLKAKYDADWLGSGSWVLGAQVDAMSVIDSQWITGRNGEWEVIRDEKDELTMPVGDETIYSGFTQLKHKLNDGVIFNLGVRYDYKDRLRGENVSAISPRTALIFGPDSTVGLKFSYSESFVDAAYWYRYNNVPNFRGTPDLLPERMRAFQLSPTLRLLNGRLRNTVNFYYANHYDVIFRNPEASADEELFQNSGQINVIGVEEELAYLDRNWRVRLNATYQRPVLADNYPATLPEIHNVPKLFGNLILDVKPLWFTDVDMWLNVSARYYAEQLSPIDIEYVQQSTGRGGVEGVKTSFVEPGRTIDDYLLLSSSLRWQEIMDTDFSLQTTVHNILDTQYEAGGSTSRPIPQPGRWYLLEASYRFDM